MPEGGDVPAAATQLVVHALAGDAHLELKSLVVQPWLAFLQHRQDSYVFQDKTVMEIVDEIFGDYAGQGTLNPLWRWDLADTAVYPRRSLSIQYNESDLAYVQRLLREEGLFYWWEHETAESKGAHTLVIADHNGAFKPNVQNTVRFTQSGASLKEDSVSQVQAHARVRTASLELASADYRSLVSVRSSHP